MKRFTTTLCFVLACMFAVSASASDRNLASQRPMLFSSGAAKASGDTIDLMGPGLAKPFMYYGNFETPATWPDLGGGWNALGGFPNHWHVDTYNNPGTGKDAWCGTLAYPSCGSDPVGGYGNGWYDILEFRHTVGPGPTLVNVKALVRYDCEPGYDYLTLQRRTAMSPNFEPLNGGQGLSWTGSGDASVDYTFNYTPAELVNGTDIAIAFIFASDANLSDADCLWPTAGGAMIDDIWVTSPNKTLSSHEDFEDNALGPDWVATPYAGAGNFAQVWSSLGDADDCASNYSKVVAFVDDGLVVPGTGGTVGGPGNDYGPPGGYIVNNTGGLLGPTAHLECSAWSPVMTWPDPAKSGISLAFDVYRHELLIPNDSPGVFYTWSVRSTAGGNIADAPWLDRNFVYYGGPNWLRSVNQVADLVVPGCTQVQFKLGVVELGYAYGFGEGTNGTPAPYFDNVRVKVYPLSGAFIAATDIHLANDGFPAIGAVDLVNLANNYVRFDMAANISPRSHLRNDPGDSICVAVTPRAGGTLDLPVMRWRFAVKNPLFTDVMRTGLPAGLMQGAVVGSPAGNGGVLVPNRYRFDLPDGPGEGGAMLFPGDILQYYFEATDHVAGDTRISTVPQNLTGFGDSTPMAWPGAFTVRCLPNLRNSAPGDQPHLLFWNDFGFAGNEDEWYGAFKQLGMTLGTDYDAYTTHGPSSGVGDGLGGRATAALMAGYTDLLYSSGDLGAFTLSNGDFAGDPGNDLGLLNAWFALGGRDAFMTGDDLASSLYTSGSVARTFLETMMGLTYNDPDVRDNIGGQVTPVVVKVAGNPVFTTANRWIAYGGCPVMNDFDNVVTFGSAVRLAQFTAPGGVSTPYMYAAATLNTSGTDRIVSMDHDLHVVIDMLQDKSPAPLAVRTMLLSNVLDYLGVSNNPDNTSGADTPVAKFGVLSYPNPFNPQLTIKYTLKNPGHVVMNVYNIRGELVKTLIDGQINETSGSVVWDGTNIQGGSVSSGVYFVETRANGEVKVLKATMMR